MSDVFAVDLALDLTPTAPRAVLDLLRRHLGLDDADDGGDAVEDVPDFVALLAGRGPAVRIGGVLMAELLQGDGHWSLTARQEIHAELLPELDALVEMLAFHAKTEGFIGQLRFYEDDAPEVLLNRAGKVVRMPLRAADPSASQ
ncbi:hypothetical protein ACIHCM_29240 [Streptomyces sp. NPDC052023]|uniref:hypothetical protein n=1 Tax=Streptomyces sp. NPDC052023 TaxID=3365681 RepID=UPI0037CE082E